MAAAVVAASLTTVVSMVTAQNAVASYAPSSAAVTSSLPAKKLALEDFENLGPKKQLQRERALGKFSVVDLLSELDGQLAKLQNQASELERLTQQQTEQPELDLLADLKRKIAEQQAERVRQRAEIEQQLAAKRKFEAELRKRAEVLEKLEGQPAWFNYFAAAAASVVSTIIMHPIDTIKTRTIIGASKPEPAAPPPPDEAVRIELREVAGVGAVETEARLVAEPIKEVSVIETHEDESWLSLYAGIGGNVAKEALPSALYLGVYEAVKHSLVQRSFPLLAAYLLAGGAGELCGSVIRAPAEAVKSLAQSGMANSTSQAFDYIKESPASRARVARAWGASILRDVPMGAIQIAIFEGLKLYILNSPTISFDVNTLSAEAAIGAIGGLMGAWVTTPTDIATTRIITADPTDDRGALTMLKDIWANEGGLTAVFNGGGQRALYWAPAIGIFLSCYCSFRQYAADSPAVTHFINELSGRIAS